MKYIVFPGNVGDNDALLKAAITLGVTPKGPSHHTPTSSSTSSSSSSTSTAAPAAAAHTGTPTSKSSHSKLLNALSAAQFQETAIAAFNVYNLEGAKAVVAAAERARSPVILQVDASLSRVNTSIVPLCLLTWSALLNVTLI